MTRHVSAPQAGDRYIRGASLIGFADHVTRIGGDPVGLAEMAGLDRQALTEFDGLISWRRAAMVVELAADVLGRPNFGLEWIESMPAHFPNAGPVVLLAGIAGTFGEWIRTSTRYWLYHTNAYAIRFIDEGGPEVLVRFHLEPLAFAPRQVMEATLGCTCRIARTITGFEDRNPSLVRFQHPAPADTTAHDALFGCPVEFSAQHNEIVFARDYLDLPSSGNLRLFRSLFDWYIRYRIRHMPVYDQSMKATVALAIQSVIGTGACTLDFVARSLGLSPKKLQRLLAQEGTAFSEIFDEVRQTMARRILSESDIPVARLAGLLEYSATTPFTLAFKRWTGMSPRAYRGRNGARAVDRPGPEGT